jgi:hypothetical protein
MQFAIVVTCRELLTTSLLPEYVRTSRVLNNHPSNLLPVHNSPITRAWGTCIHRSDTASNSRINTHNNRSAKCWLGIPTTSIHMQLACPPCVPKYHAILEPVVGRYAQTTNGLGKWRVKAAKAMAPLDWTDDLKGLGTAKTQITDSTTPALKPRI